MNSILNEKFGFLTQRIVGEVEFAMRCLDKSSMAYNEIKFSKCVYHVMFMQALGSHVNAENRDLKARVDSKIAENTSNLNCFMNLFL
jgi:hypothetical protein